jgi:hypothetical protein
VAAERERAASREAARRSAIVDRYSRRMRSRGLSRAWTSWVSHVSRRRCRRQALTLLDDVASRMLGRRSYLTLLSAFGHIKIHSERMFAAMLLRANRLVHQTEEALRVAQAISSGLPTATRLGRDPASWRTSQLFAVVDRLDSVLDKSAVRRKRGAFAAWRTTLGLHQNSVAEPSMQTPTIPARSFASPRSVPAVAAPSAVAATAAVAADRATPHSRRTAAVLRRLKALRLSMASPLVPVRSPGASSSPGFLDRLNAVATFSPDASRQARPSLSGPALAQATPQSTGNDGTTLLPQSLPLPWSTARHGVVRSAISASSGPYATAAAQQAGTTIALMHAAAATHRVRQVALESRLDYAFSQATSTAPGATAVPGPVSPARSLPLRVRSPGHIGLPSTVLPHTASPAAQASAVRGRDRSSGSQPSLFGARR